MSHSTIEQTKVHDFTVTGTWRGGLKGHGRLAADGLATDFAAAQDLGGSGVGTNPEALLAGAAGGCFLITLAAILAKAGLPVAKLNVRTDAQVTTQFPLSFKSLRHTPQVEPARAMTEQEVAQIVEACHKAETFCLVSTALRGNVAISLDLSQLTQNPHRCGADSTSREATSLHARGVNP